MRPNRREALQVFGAVAVPWGLGLYAKQAHAGAQIEEPLSAAVRTALSAAVADEAPPKPTFDKDDERHEHERWLQRLSARLTRVKSETQTREEFLQTVWYESRRAALDTSLVLGLIQVESGFRKYAISSAGARRGDGAVNARRGTRDQPVPALRRAGRDRVGQQVPGRARRRPGARVRRDPRVEKQVLVAR